MRVCGQVLKMGEMGMMGIEVEKQVIHTRNKYMQGPKKNPAYGRH